MENISYEERKYRDWVAPADLVTFQVSELETDLHISADKKLENESIQSIKKYRKEISEYIKTHRDFKKSFLPVTVSKNARQIIKDMADAGHKANVGPFAAVAGAMAEYVGRDLLKHSSQIIIENGGDIFISSLKDRILGIYAGNSPLTGKIGIRIETGITPVGVCTSSGTVGHSTSFGKADSVTIISKSTALADAVATATANIVQSESDINKAIEFAKNIQGIQGILIIIGKHIGAFGAIELVNT